jgi:hypothetical protein
MAMTEVAQANPALLPNHPGYPARGEFANDAGRQNLTHNESLRDAAVSGNANIVQDLENPNNAMLLRSEGAGQLSLEQAAGGVALQNAATDPTMAPPVTTPTKP